MSFAGLRPFSLVVWLTVAALAGIVAFTACAGVVDSMPLAWIVALAAAGAVGWRIATHPGVAMLVERAPRGFRVAFSIGAIAVVGQLALLTAFVIDPNVATWSSHPVRPWQSRHSCVSCYWAAAEVATRVPDLYAEPVYRLVIAPTVERRPNLGPFFVDVFEYPPTFLPLPRLLALVTPDFWGFRRLWFAINLAGFAIGPQAQVVGWAYTLVLVAAIAWLALRRSDRGLDPVLRIAILVLTTLLAAWAVRTGAPLLPIVALWLVLAASVGQGFLTPPANAVLTLSHTIASLAVVVLACRRSGPKTS